MHNPAVQSIAEHLHLLTPTYVQGRATFLALLKNWFWCVPALLLSHLMCVSAHAAWVCERMPCYAY